MPPRRLRQYYELIKALDPYHPVIVTCAIDSALAGYRDAMDVHWTQVYGTPAHVHQRMERHRASLHRETPISAILHCYDRQQSSILKDGGTPDPALFTPTPRQMRATAFMALAYGSSGLEWWWWGHAGRSFYTVAHVPDAWEGLKQVVADISSLRPLLTADGEVHRWVEKPSEGVSVHIWEKKLPDRSLIIAVNESETQAVELELLPKTIPAGASVQMLFDGGTATVTDGALHTSLEPWGVRVYEYRGH